MDVQAIDMTNWMTYSGLGFTAEELEGLALFNDESKGMCALCHVLDPVVGGPDRLLGYEVYENPAVESLATGNKSVFFGHWGSVKVATTGLDVATSADYAFNEDETTYRFVYRLGAGLTHGSHIKFIEMA